MKLAFKSACLFLFLCGSISAQTTPREPSFGDMFKQMQELMEQMKRGNGMHFSFPDNFGSDSLGNGFFFRMDTSITFGDDLFRTMPNKEGGMHNMQDFLKQFEQMGFTFGLPEGTDDGQSRSEEDLLPEEELRNEEEHKAGPKSDETKQKPVQKKQERKTVRI